MTSPNSDEKDLYETLGVTPDADAEAIAEAYRRKAQQYHPDKVSHLGAEFRELAEARMRRINAAYEILRDPEKRLAYDSHALRETAPPSAPKKPSPPSERASTEPASPFARWKVSRGWLYGVTGPLLAAILGLVVLGVRGIRQRTSDQIGAEFTQAQEYFGNAQWQEALVLLHRVTKARPDDAQAWTLRWRTELSLNLYEDGRKSLEQTISLNPTSATLRIEYARVLFALGEVNAVRTELLWLEKNGETATVAALLNAFRKQNPDQATQLEGER